MTFYDKFIELCDSRNTYPSTVATDLGFTPASATKWKDGAVPRAVTIKKIADYFGVPVTYFNEDEKEEKPVKDELSEAQIRAIQLVRLMDDNTLEIFIAAMEKALKK